MANELYTNARCSALESKLLTKKKLVEIIEGNTDEAIKILNENKIGEGIENILDYEKMLVQEKQKLYSLIKTLNPSKDIQEYFMLKIDFLNAEILYRIKVTKNEQLVKLFELEGMVSIDLLRKSLETKKYDNLPKGIIKSFDELEKCRELTSKKISATFKKNYYSELELKDKILMQIIRTKIDLINIETFFRVSTIEEFEDEMIEKGRISKEFFVSLYKAKSNEEKLKISKECYLFDDIKKIIDNGKENRFFDIEKRIDDVPLEILRNYKYEISGNIPLLRYLFEYEAQMKNICIVLVGLINKLDSEEIKERLRCGYER